MCHSILIVFRVKGGMGAALLKNSETATDILKTLRRNINCPVTCKIRLLDTIEEVSYVRSHFIETDCLQLLDINCIAIDWSNPSWRIYTAFVQTVDFARMCESTGISAIAVHARVSKAWLMLLSLDLEHALSEVTWKQAFVYFECRSVMRDRHRELTGTCSL